MGVRYFPDLNFSSNIEASHVAVAPSCEHSSIIFRNCAADTSLHFGVLDRCDSSVFRQVPDLKSAALVDGNKTIAVLSEANVIDGRTVGVGVK